MSGKLTYMIGNVIDCLCWCRLQRRIAKALKNALKTTSTSRAPS
jgi:hypothetical protein